MHLLFDLDGTLTDPFEGITNCIRYALEQHGFEAPAAQNLKWCIGPPLRSSFQQLTTSDNQDLLDNCLKSYRERFTASGLYENRLVDGIVEVLEGLDRQKHTLWVATSKPAVYARRIIAHFGLDQYFLNVYGSELDGTRTNKVELLNHLLQKEQLSPADTLMIGDREHDVYGARNNQLAAIGVLWGYGSHEELTQAGAHALVDTPGELSLLLNNWTFHKPVTP